MKRAFLAIALLVVGFGATVNAQTAQLSSCTQCTSPPAIQLTPRILQPRQLAPIPVARNCRPTDACLRNCERQGGTDCYQQCDRCK
jgi:hypothetical protein